MALRARPWSPPWPGPAWARYFSRAAPGAAQRAAPGARRSGAPPGGPGPRCCRGVVQQRGRNPSLPWRRNRAWRRAQRPTRMGRRARPHHGQTPLYRGASATQGTCVLHRGRACYTGDVRATQGTCVLHRGRACYTGDVRAMAKRHSAAAPSSLRTSGIKSPAELGWAGQGRAGLGGAQGLSKEGGLRWQARAPSAARPLHAPPAAPATPAHARARRGGALL
jgi:hypothetical protein